MNVRLKWITPDADGEIGYMARVSNPKAKPDDPVAKLIQYLLDHKHVSPFEMANACFEINTTRDIARQILRHKSIHFQEFSQRYAVADEKPEFADARLQDYKNRQNSIPTSDEQISKAWSLILNSVWDCCWAAYKSALALGIAKELARKVLPEGLTRTRMYANGTIRDWLFYLNVRTDKSTQYEHRVVALGVQRALEEHCPITFEAARQAGLIGPIENAPGDSKGN